MGLTKQEWMISSLADMIVAVEITKYREESEQ